VGLREVGPSGEGGGAVGFAHTWVRWVFGQAFSVVCTDLLHVLVCPSLVWF
jgi:hypothetical protein